MAGYCVEGTLAKHILSEPEEITTMNGQKLPLKMQVKMMLYLIKSLLKILTFGKLIAGHLITCSYKMGKDDNFECGYFESLRMPPAGLG